MSTNIINKYYEIYIKLKGAMPPILYMNWMGDIIPIIIINIIINICEFIGMIDTNLVLQIIY